MPRSLYTLHVDTENAALLASECKSTEKAPFSGEGVTGTVGVSCASGISPQQIEDARRNLTLAALRWQAALDDAAAEVS